MKASPLVFRIYGVHGEPDRQVMLTIHKPRPWCGDWACRIRIEGIPNGRARVPGIDPLQALQLAILQARRMLDASGLPLVWGDGGVPGDVGIPLLRTDHQGLRVPAQAERHVERETKRFDEAVAAFVKARDWVAKAKKVKP